MFCAKCGTKQGEGEKFCPTCGTKFEEVTITAQKSEDNAAPQTLNKTSLADIETVGRENSATTPIVNPNISYSDAEKWLSEIFNETNSSSLIDIDNSNRTGIVSDIYLINKELLFDSRKSHRRIEKLELRDKLRQEEFKKVSENESLFRFYIEEKNIYNIRKRIRDYENNTLKGIRNTYEYYIEEKAIEAPFGIRPYEDKYKNIYLIRGRFARMYKMKYEKGALKRLFMSEEAKRLIEQEEKSYKVFLEVADFIETYKI